MIPAPGDRLVQRSVGVFVPIVFVPILIAATMLATGCAAAQNAASGMRSRTLEPSTPLANVFPTDLPGLEVQWWTVTGDGAPLVRALARYEDEPTPITPAVASNWQRNGLRMIRVPTSAMSGLLASLPIEDRVNRAWLGQAPSWTVAAAGTPWTGERALRIDGESIRLDSGQLRLLVRAWTSPTEGAPILRTDLALQYVDNRSMSIARSPFQGASLREPTEEGLVFRSLTAPMELDGAFAYCIVAEDPETDWKAMLGVREEPDSDQEPRLPAHAADLLEQPIEEPDPLGPEPRAIPVLADALLSEVGASSAVRRARSLVILTPVVPASYRLAPR